MINTTDPSNFQLTWQAMLWRLLVTILLLLALAGFGLTHLDSASPHPQNQGLPPVTQGQVGD